MGITIVHGAQGTVKTRRAEELKKHYDCTHIVDGWDGEEPLQDGALAITNIAPPYAIRGARIVGIATAKRAICG